MKKFFGILLTLTLFAVAPAAAQFNWGIKAGVNSAERPSNLGELKSAAKGEAGWFVGPMAKVTLPIVGLGVEADLLYSQTNTEIGGKTIKNKCIDLPVYLRYELSLPVVNKFLEPFVAAGPQWSWNIGDKTYSIADMIDGGQQALSQYTLRNSNLSLNLGLGAVVLDHVQLHVNYNIALGSTSEYSDPTQTVLNLATKSKSKTNTWQFSLAYIF